MKNKKIKDIILLYSKFSINKINGKKILDMHKQFLKMKYKNK